MECMLALDGVHSSFMFHRHHLVFTFSFPCQQGIVYLQLYNLWQKPNRRRPHLQLLAQSVTKGHLMSRAVFLVRLQYPEIKSVSAAWSWKANWQTSKIEIKGNTSAGDSWITTAWCCATVCTFKHAVSFNSYANYVHINLSGFFQLVRCFRLSSG